MKKISIAYLILVTLFLTGCVHPYIGKDIGYSVYTQWLDKAKGHHNITMKHLVFDYDYTMKNNKIYFDGTITCNKKNTTDWDNAEISIDILFLDKNTVVQEVGHFSNLDANEDLCASKPFQANYPNNIKGKVGVIFDYKVKMWQ